MEVLQTSPLTTWVRRRDVQSNRERAVLQREFPGSSRPLESAVTVCGVVGVG